MRRWITMVIAAGVFCSCGESSHEQSYVRSVALVEPVLLEPVHVINRPGIVREAHAISLGFKTAGQIERIYAHEGDYVRQGDLLAELDDADYRLGVEALQVQYDQLEDEVERMGRLFNQKSVSANDYEKAVAGLRQLGVQLQLNKNKLDYTRLYASTDGYVQNVNFSPAEMVDAGTPLFTLLDLSRMEVTVDIPVSEYRQFDQFIRYSCRATGIDGEMPMTLLSVTPKADGNQLYQLRLAFSEQYDGRLTAGMNVGIGITVRDTTSVSRVAIPLRAVFRDNDKNEPCVWVFERDSTVTKQPVVLDGTDPQGRAVVIEGLTGEERIVRAGVNVLHEGERVRVVEKASETNKGGLL